jgi:hypothetical protein
MTGNTHRVATTLIVALILAAIAIMVAGAVRGGPFLAPAHAATIHARTAAATRVTRAKMTATVNRMAKKRCAAGVVVVDAFTVRECITGHWNDPCHGLGPVQPTRGTCRMDVTWMWHLGPHEGAYELCHVDVLFWLTVFPDHSVLHHSNPAPFEDDDCDFVSPA